MILRVAHFRTHAAAATASASTAQSMLSRIRRIDGLAWSAVGRQQDGDEVVIIAVSLWRDRAAMDQMLSAAPDGRSEVEAREGLPEPAMVELAEVVDGMGLPPGFAPADTLLGRRRRGLLPQDRELLRLLCGGSTLAEAARTLGVSVGTAKNRRHEIYEKLGVHDLNAACSMAAAELTADEGSIAS